MYCTFISALSCEPYSVKACKSAIKNLGYIKGGKGYSFKGNDYSEKGCYAYTDGYFKGHAFYGTRGTQAQMQKELTGNKYRPPGYDCGKLLPEPLMQVNPV